MAHKKKNYRLSRLSRPKLIIGGIVVITVVVVTGLELTNTTHIFHKAPLVKIAVINSTSSQSKTSANKSKPTSTSSPSVSSPSVASSSSSSSKDTSTGGGTSTSSTTLIAPYGDFVSTHTPKLGDAEVSVCNTTPAATCTITFTMGNTTRSLNPQTVDSNGSTSWTWVVDDSSSGFVPGNWQITVTSALNGQTKVVNDSRLFEVAQ